MKTCGIEKCLRGKEVDLPAASGYSLHVVLWGKGVLRIGEKEYPVHAGQMFLTVPGLPAWYRADDEEPWHYCWITLDGTQAPRYMELAGFSEGTYVIPCNIDTTCFLPIIENILKIPHLNLASDLYRHGLACQFMALVIESREKTILDPSGCRSMSADDYVEYAVNYINENYASVSIGELARYIGLNRSYFTVLFRSRVRVSPKEYVISVRMSRALDLLMYTDYSIRMISEAVGYDNQLTFSKMFKKKYGMSPENYRLAYRRKT